MEKEPRGRESLHLRVTHDLKTRLKNYAASKGISTAAAAAVLLDEALRARETVQ